MSCVQHTRIHTLQFLFIYLFIFSYLRIFSFCLCSFVIRSVAFSSLDSCFRYFFFNGLNLPLFRYSTIVFWKFLLCSIFRKLPNYHAHSWQRLFCSKRLTFKDWHVDKCKITLNFISRTTLLTVIVCTIHKIFCCVYTANAPKSKLVRDYD